MEAKEFGTTLVFSLFKGEYFPRVLGEGED